MKSEKLKIANLVKDLILYIDKNLVNFPKKEIELKHKIVNSGYELLRIIYEANATTNNQLRLEYQEKSIALVKYLDFLINLCYEKQIINGKRYIKFGEKLELIVRYIVAWSNNTKSIKSSLNV